VVPGHFAALDFLGAFVDGDGVFDAACAGAALSSRSAGCPAAAEFDFEFAGQLTTGVDEQRLVDRLVADAHGLIVGEENPQTSSDLLWGEALLEQVAHPRA